MPFVTVPGTNRKIKSFDGCEGAAEFRQALRLIHAAGGTQIEAGELQHVREFLRRRRMSLNGRAFHERNINELFDQGLSRLLDGFLVEQERLHRLVQGGLA